MLHQKLNKYTAISDPLEMTHGTTDSQFSNVNNRDSNSQSENESSSSKIIPYSSLKILTQTMLSQMDFQLLTKHISCSAKSKNCETKQIFWGEGLDTL
jgi:hypothetical protein